MEGNNNEEDKEKEVKPSCCVRFRTSMRNAGHFMYNRETKEVLGRSGISWLKILSFYFAFYAVLAGFWAVCMVVFYQTLDPNAPTMQKMFSMMKDNPGMNYEPFTDTSKTLISFNPNDTKTYNDYVVRLNKVYLDFQTRSNAIDPKPKQCSHGNGATPEEFCRFDVTALGGNCTPETGFGYQLGKPCVLLRINKIFLWDPRNITFDSEDKCSGSDAGKDECKKHAEFLKLPKAVRSNVEPGYVSVSCEGENDGDRDNINGVSFYPSGGYPTYFYPYYNQHGYTTPPVMAQFDVVIGRVTMILCKVWTRDIIHDKNDLQGSIHFELFVGP